MKKAGFMKDALVLFAITVVAGLLLGGTYQLTKTPIALAEEAANQEAYKTVFADAASFALGEDWTAAIEKTNEELATMDYGNVAVDKVLTALDANQNEIGHVIVSHSDDSYGGTVQLSVGLDEEGTILGVELLSINDTPGLGMKAQEPEFKNQYIGKNAESLSVKKGGGAGETEIDSISGATITSSAVTNAVNAALYFVHHGLEVAQ